MTPVYKNEVKWKCGSREIGVKLKALPSRWKAGKMEFYYFTMGNSKKNSTPCSTQCAPYGTLYIESTWATIASPSPEPFEDWF